MNTNILAGFSREKINFQIGIRKIGKRLFADPIEGIESDLLVSVIIFNFQNDSVVIVACDLCGIPISVVQELREKISKSLKIPFTNILVNESHTHSCPAFPIYFSDDSEQIKLKEKFQNNFFTNTVKAFVDAHKDLQLVRIGTGLGNCQIGVYLREKIIKVKMF